jgi:hypothetical protein
MKNDSKTSYSSRDGLWGVVAVLAVFLIEEINPSKEIRDFIITPICVLVILFIVTREIYIGYKSAGKDESESDGLS